MIAEAKRSTDKNIATYLIGSQIKEKIFLGLNTNAEVWALLGRQQTCHRLTQKYQKSKERTTASIGHVAF